ncbi:MAG TPA: hypothetical protein VIC57_19070 [Candidatus Dormibacteraeota bacterium]|jgi:hypothetical protein
MHRMLRVAAGAGIAGLIVLGVVLTTGWTWAGAHARGVPVAIASGDPSPVASDPPAPSPTPFPSPVPQPSPTPLPFPSPSDVPMPSPTPTATDDFTICEAGDDPSPCLGPEPVVCAADPVASPSPTIEVVTFAFRLDPPKPCTIKVQQVVAVSELFQAPSTPKVGDTLDIELNLTVPSKARDTAQAAIDMVTKKGKTVLSVTIRAKVYMVDDLGALVVYAQVDSVTVSAKGNYSLTQAFTNGAKFALPVVVK